MNGLVKWWNKKLGYGFIAMRPTDKLQFGIPAEVDLYVHARGIVGKYPRNLCEGQRVEFDVVRGPKGWEAGGVMAVASGLRPEPEPEPKPFPQHVRD